MEAVEAAVEGGVSTTGVMPAVVVADDGCKTVTACTLDCSRTSVHRGGTCLVLAGLGWTRMILFALGLRKMNISRID